MNSPALSIRAAHARGKRARRRPGSFVVLSIVLLLASCNAPPAGLNGELPTLTPPSRPATATSTDAPPDHTPTPRAATPVPVLVTPSATPCTHDYFFAPAPPLCPREPPVESAAAEQPFSGGVMIWLESAGAIVVFFPDGQWQRYADTWTEAEADSDPALDPPEGFFQPIRGFGKVWREHPELQERLGWATSVELGYTAQFQRAVSAAGEQVAFLRTYNGQTYYLNELEPGRGTWGIAASW